MAVWQTEGHQYHDPSSAADRAELPMHSEVEALVIVLLEGGMKPYNVWRQVHAGQISMGSQPGGSLEAASDARWNITLPQVYAVRKKLQLAGRVVSDQRRQEQRLGTTVAELGSSGVQLLPGAPGLTWQEREGGQRQGRRHGLLGGPQLHLPIQR